MKLLKNSLFHHSKKNLHPRDLIRVYQVLRNAFGPRDWWPADSDFEMILGAILTQNTAWTNVEKAICNLKKAQVLDPQSLYSLPESKLAELIRPAGYFNVKAKRIRAFLQFLFHEYEGDLKKMLGTSGELLRQQLLDVNGVGPETADSILLYAARKSFFVIDAYTKRIFTRHALFDQKLQVRRIRKKLAAWNYEDWQKVFSENLPADTELFNDFHAQIVEVAKRFCLASKALCESCPLSVFLGH